MAFDLILAGDLAGGVESCLRIAGEAVAAARAGYKVALLHVPFSSDSLTPISPEVRACLREPSVQPLDLEVQVAAQVLVIHPPLHAAGLQQVSAAVDGKRVVFVPESPVDVDELASVAAASFPKATVAPVSDAMRKRLRAHPSLRVEPRDWRPIVEGGRKGSLPGRRELVVGAVIPPDWPKAVDAIKDIVAGSDDVQVYVWRDRGARRELPSVPGHWRALDGVEISFEWFLRRIDVLLVLEHPNASDLPEAVIAAAQAAGKHVAAPTGLHEGLPPSVITAAPRELMEAVRRACVSGAVPGKVRARNGPKGETAASLFLKRLRVLTGASARPARGRGQSPRSHRPRVLFVPKGGVGVGHVARLLAIARRAGGEYEPVLVTLADSTAFIEELGFRAEFIPSNGYAGAPPGDWDPWFQYELEHLIDAYDASAVVWDGSDPPAVLSRAVASRSGCRGVWVRRAMWEPGYNPSLQRSGNYDVIIEPGELAAARDRGATVARRQEAHRRDGFTQRCVRQGAGGEGQPTACNCASRAGGGKGPGRGLGEAGCDL